MVWVPGGKTIWDIFDINGGRGQSSTSRAIFGENAFGFYGQTIPVTGGYRAINGVLLWASPFTVRDNEAYANFAIGFGYPGYQSGGNETFINKLYFNGKKVYDATAVTAIQVHDGLNFKLYNGSEDQTPDGTIARYEGIGNTPAFRGMVYAVFENVKLSEFGLVALPTVRAELIETEEQTNFIYEYSFGSRTAEYADYTHQGPQFYNKQGTKSYRIYWNPARERFNIATFDMIGQRFVSMREITIDYTGNVHPTRQAAILAGSVDFAASCFLQEIEVIVCRESGISNSMPWLALRLSDAKFFSSAGVRSSGLSYITAQGEANNPHDWRLLATNDMFALPTADFTSMRRQLMFGYSIIGGRGIVVVSVDPQIGFVSSRHSDLGNSRANNQCIRCVYNGSYGKNTDHNVTLFGYQQPYWSQSYKIVAVNSDLTFDLLTIDNAYYYSFGNYFSPFDDPNAAGVFKTKDASALGSTELEEYYTLIVNDPANEVPTGVITPYGNDIGCGDAQVFLSDGTATPFIGLLYQFGVFTRHAVTGQVNYYYYNTKNIADAIVTNIRDDVELRPAAKFNHPGNGMLRGDDISVAATSAVNSGNFFYFFDVYTGAYRVYDDVREGIVKTDGDAAYLENYDELIYFDLKRGRYTIAHAVGDWEIFSFVFDRADPITTTLKSAIEAFMDYSGYDEDEYSVSADLAEVIDGFIVNTDANLWDIIDEMKKLFRFRYFQSGNALKFVPIGNADDPATATLDNSDLMPINRNRSTRSFVIGFAPADTLPTVAEVNYINRHADYNIGTQTARRSTFPVNTRETADSDIIINVPLVMTSQLAAEKIYAVLYNAYESNKGYQLRLSVKDLQLEPGDLLEVTYENILYLISIISVYLENDDSLSIKGETLPGAVDIDIEVDEPIYPDPDIVSYLISQLLILQLPYLTADAAVDEDTPTYNPLVVPVTPNPLFTATINSAVNDGVTVTIAERWRNIFYGEAINALPAGWSPCIYDTDNALVVRDYSDNFGALSSAAEDDARSGLVNLLLVGRANEFEIMTYTDVAYDDIDDLYTFTGLLRGLRGTEGAVDGHQVGDFVIPLFADFPVLPAFGFEAAQAGQSAAVEAVTTTDTLSTSAALEARPLQPLAPVHVGSSGSWGGDIDLTWVRQSRTGRGDLEDGADAPLGEDTEAYEVDVVLDDVIVRILSVSAETATYTAADQATDYGGTPTTVDFVIYQIGANSLRGLPTTYSFEV